MLVPLLLGVLLALVVAGVVALLGGEDEGGIQVGAMSISEEQLSELSRETMGESDLRDVPTATHESARADEPGRLEGGVRRFELTARPVRWEYREGQTVAAWGFEGQMPGPTLRANEGERVEITIRNDLPHATTVHWHGMDVPWKEDGVPGITQEAIEPGESYTYEFPATPSGTRWYHTHGSEMGEEASQLDMGLFGAFVVTPKDPPRPAADVDQVLVLDELNVAEGGVNVAMLGGHAGHAGESNVFTINGLAMPSTKELVVRRGDVVRLRFVNASSRSYHPMHLHGHQFSIVALDGNEVEQPVSRNVALLAPGETADVEFVANNPGVWLIHCHDLHHADAGMSMVLRYDGFEPGDDTPAGDKATGDKPAGTKPARAKPAAGHPHGDGDDH